MSLSISLFEIVTLGQYYHIFCLYCDLNVKPFNVLQKEKNICSKKVPVAQWSRHRFDAGGFPGLNPVSDIKKFSDTKINTPSPLTW